MVAGATALAEFAHVVAARYPVHVALHTDHCPPDKLDGYLRPLLAASEERVAAGREPLFQSQMWDGSRAAATSAASRVCQGRSPRETP
jgi:fructose-bisphosphate aldolase, class II